jgi:hypothetical protein
MSAILQESPDEGRVVDVEWAPAQKEPSASRYNPFVLRWYAECARDAHLTADDIASGGAGIYIERRILGRLPQAVRDLLPAAARLGRFDRAMIKPALPGAKPDDVDAAFRALSGQDWIDYRRGRVRDLEFLEIDRGLRVQLEKHWQGPIWDGVGENLAAGIAELIEERPCDQLGVEHLSAAFDLVPPERMSALWHRLERRISQEGEWAWAAAVTDRLLAVDGPIDRAGGSSRAAALATNVAARSRFETRPDFRTEWTSVLESADADPDEEVRDWLEARASAGLFAATAADEDAPSEAFWSLVRRSASGEPTEDGRARYRAVQLQASIGAALAIVLDGVEDGVGTDRLDMEAMLRWADEVGRDGSPAALRCLAHTIAARAHALAGRWDEADRSFAAADDALPKSDDAASDRWLDWRVPRSLRHRIRLEAVSALAGRSAEVLTRAGQWEQDTWGPIADGERPQPVDTIDRERLASALLNLRLTRAPPDVQLLHWLESVDVYAHRLPECAAHERVPPLAVRIAQGWVAHANGGRGWSHLTARLDDATAHDDLLTVRSVRRWLAVMLRRLRAAGYGGFAATLADSANPADQDAAVPFVVLALPVAHELPAAGLSVKPPVDATDAAAFHRWWRCQYVRGPARAASLAATALPVHLDRLRAGSAFDLQSVELDGVEAARLSHREPPPLADEVRDASLLSVERRARLELRRHVLLDSPASPEPRELLKTDMFDSLGRRRTAELALDEGELLSLRLPIEGARMLAIALTGFEDTGDRAGVVAAGTTAALALVRADRPEEARKLLEARVRPAYEAILAEPLGPTGPVWNQLASSIRKPQAAERADWEGWRVRLSTALAASASHRRPLSPNVGIRGFNELDFADEEAIEPKPSEHWIRLRRATLALLAVLILLGVAGTVLLPVYLVVTGSWEGLRYWLALVAGYLSLALLHWIFTSSVRPALAARAPATITIARRGAAPSTRSGWPPPADLIAVLSQVRWEPRLERRQLAPRVPIWIPLLLRDVWATEVIRSEWPRPYSALAPMLPEGVGGELKRLTTLTRDRRIQLRLLTDTTVAGLPWEAILGLYAFGSPRLTAWDAVRVPRVVVDPVGGTVRTGASAAPSTRPGSRPGSARVPSTAVLASRAWQPLAEGRWYALGWPVTAVSEISEADSAAVVHIVAVAVPSSDGPLLRIGGDEADGARQMRGIAQSVRPERLPVRGAVVLLQGEPLDGATRSDAERTQTADLRLCAAGIMDAGAKVVVMLPSVSSPLAAQALSRLAPAMRAQLRRGFMPDLMRAVEDVRLVIAGDPAADQADRRELALDVCVFTTGWSKRELV